MRLNQLEGFLAVAKARSFTQAAREVGVTQAGLSRQVQRLEDELGVALFEREEGRLELTEAGRRAHAFAQETVSRHRELVRSLSRRPEALHGALSIAASTTPGEFLVPELVGSFTSRYPGVQPQVSISDSTLVLEKVREGKAEIGFTGVLARVRGLQHDVVAADEIILVVPARHPFASRKSVALADLEGQVFVEREDGSGTLKTVHQILAGHGKALPPHRVAMALTSIQAVLMGVERGHGVGWVSSRAVADGWNGRVAAVRLKGLPLLRQLYMVHDRRRALTPQGEAFMRWVLEANRAKAEAQA